MRCILVPGPLHLHILVLNHLMADPYLTLSLEAPSCLDYAQQLTVAFSMDDAVHGATSQPRTH